MKCDSNPQLFGERPLSEEHAKAVMWPGIRVLLLCCIALASSVCADEHSHKVTALVCTFVRLSLTNTTITGCALTVALFVYSTRMGNLSGFG